MVLAEGEWRNREPSSSRLGGATDCVLWKQLAERYLYAQSAQRLSLKTSLPSDNLFKMFRIPAFEAGH